MKIAPIVGELRAKSDAQGTNKLSWKLIHTGQHYDSEMSEAFFHDLEIPSPDIYLGVGSGSHAEQTARVMIEFEKVCLKEEPDLVIVVGDVNSTLACALVAAKLCVPVAHVEAGLRSYDRTMPEEINRILTDSISDYLFTTCEDANENLKKEGVSEEKIHFVGNVMIDSLLKFRNKAEAQSKIKMNKKDYALLTLHRPSNVDHRDAFKNIIEALQEISNNIPIIFPAHPRTRKQIQSFGFEKYFDFIDSDLKDLLNPGNSINLLKPLPYLEFLNLMANAKLVYTDSGGIQEETTILGIPCLTIRENTERPVTIREGTNTLVGSHRDKILEESHKILIGKGKKGRIPYLWDGNAAERIVNILFSHLQEA